LRALLGEAKEEGIMGDKPADGMRVIAPEGDGTGRARAVDNAPSPSPSSSSCSARCPSAAQQETPEPLRLVRGIGMRLARALRARDYVTVRLRAIRPRPLPGRRRHSRSEPR
jgi:hypothetical protein